MGPQGRPGPPGHVVSYSVFVSVSVRVQTALGWVVVGKLVMTRKN